MLVERLQYIDFAKGISILFVVMGHIVQYNLKGESPTVVFNFIYSFHMPLFFFLSGYVAALSNTSMSKDKVLSFIRKKGVSLLLPFITWGIIVNMLMRNINVEEVLQQFWLLFSQPDRGPWFLYTLFVVQMAFLLERLLICYFKEYSRIAELSIVSLAILLVAILGITSHNSFINPYYAIAFFVGYFYKLWFNGESKNLLLLSSFVLFILLSPQFVFTTSGGVKNL